MKKLRTELLISAGSVTTSPEWRSVQVDLDQAIAAITWPHDSPIFTINPTKEGNGVVPIKKAFVLTLEGKGWQSEQRTIPTVGKIDAVLPTTAGTFAVEWETGNISSSHRSLNRMVKGIREGHIVGGVVVLPSRALYTYLTDRIGNFQELEPYFAQYRDYPIPNGVLAVIEIEHDATDPTVPLIRKGTDGRALV